MRKLLFIVSLILFTTALFAQDNTIYQLTAKTPEQAKVIADGVADLVKQKYESSRVTEYSNQTANSPTYALCYYNDITQNSCNLLVEFRKYMIGENKDLEIEGEPFYFVIKMRGKFLDVFPVWKQHFNPNAIQEETVKKWKEEVTLDIPDLGTEYKFRLTNENDFWQIQGSSVWKKPSN
jgi:hypothetical protein